MKAAKNVEVPLSEITADQGAQSRAQMDGVLVHDYKEAWLEGADFPAIDLFEDAETGEKFIGAGFHRFAGAELAGKASIKSNIYPGGLRSAILHGISDNLKNGKRLTNDDKRRGVVLLLEDSEWRLWNNSEIARKTGSSPEFVRQQRAAMYPEEAGKTRKVKRGDQEFEVKARTKKEKPASPAPAPEAVAALRETPIADDPKQLQQLGKMPEERQAEAAALIAAGQARTVNDAQKILNRRELDAEPLPAGKFSIIYADPPWAYDNDGMRDAAAQQYPPMSLEQIQALPVGELAADRCVLFLWGTVPLAREAFAVLDAWGFDYKSKLAWVKNTVTRGFYCLGKYEELYIATRGVHVVPTWRPDNVKEFDTREHSRKPDEFLELIEQMYPAFKDRIELFARESGRPGWTVWGNQTDKFSEAA